MELIDPVKIYVASSNIKAQLMAQLLQSKGIDAYAGEDQSPAGLWLGGTAPGVFDAGVFVSQVDADRAIAVIREWEQLEKERFVASGTEVEAICDECGKTSQFAAVLRGTVQDCPHCGEMVDVGEMDDMDEEDGD